MRSCYERMRGVGVAAGIDVETIKEPVIEEEGTSIEGRRLVGIHGHHMATTLLFIECPGRVSVWRKEVV